MIEVVRNDFVALAILSEHGVFPDHRDFIGVTFSRDGQFLGAAGLDGMCGGSASFMDRHEATIHCAGSRCWSRRSIGKFFGWAFDELGFKRITSQIVVGNERSLRMTEGIGFVREGVKRCAGPNGEDAIILGCMASDLKFRRL